MRPPRSLVALLALLALASCLPALAAAQTPAVRPTGTYPARTLPAWGAGYCGLDTARVAIVAHALDTLDTTRPERGVWLVALPGQAAVRAHVVLTVANAAPAVAAGAPRYRGYCAGYLARVAGSPVRWDLYMPSTAPTSRAYVKVFGLAETSLLTQRAALAGALLYDLRAWAIP